MIEKSRAVDFPAATYKLFVGAWRPLRRRQSLPHRWNLLWTWLRPLADDSIAALLAFYGPMFFVWGVASYFAAGPSGSIRRAVLTGIVVSFTTFCVLDLMVIARANIFLNELAGRPDWRGLVDQFDGSGFDSFRAYINWHYVTQAPLKIIVATLIGMTDRSIR